MPNQPLFERLIFFEDNASWSAAENMAVDEALFFSQKQPWLRVYQWQEPSVSIGCFEPWDQALAIAGPRPLVRRWTGGGLVEHGTDWTWSVGVPEGEPFLKGRLRDCYERLHSALLATLTETGAAGFLQNGPPEPSKAEKHSLTNCFAAPVTHDVMVAEGKKLAGGAIRRTREGLLYQGSVAWPKDLSRATAGHSLATQLSGITVESQPIPFDLLEEIPRIVASRYGNAAWCRDRS
jgi:lipoyl(octanoyl) transferase